MPDLKPCPNPRCKSGSVLLEREGNRGHFVRCPTCWLRGPFLPSFSEAARLWNALPRIQPTNATPDVSSTQDRPAEDDNPLETDRENPMIAKESEMRLDIAIRAMQAMLLSGGYETMFPDGLACDAVRLADAMVEELQTKGDDGETPPW
jgi:hypothetical protein